MRILRVHNYYQERGGEDVQFEAEVELLRQNGEDVFKVTASNEKISAGKSPAAMLRLGTSTVWSKAGYRLVSDAVAQHNPDVVHFDNTFPLISPSAYSAARDADVAVVQTLHNYRLLCSNGLFFRDGRVCEDCLGKTPPYPGVVHGCYRDSKVQTTAVAAMLTVHRLRRTWSRDVDRYVAFTTFARNKLIEGGLPGAAITVKPHFLPRVTGVNTSIRNGFVFVGRLVDYKGVELFPPAWQLVESQVPLRIMGSGPLAEFVKMSATNDSRIEYFGRQSKLIVLAEMKAAAAVIVPSLLYETFGLTIVEAFSCGTPVIASRLGAMAELVDHGTTGLLFEPGNAGDLAAKVCWAAEHPEEMRRMGENARCEYEAKYTPERNYEMLMDIYQQAIYHAASRRT